MNFEIGQIVQQENLAEAKAWAKTQTDTFVCTERDENGKRQYVIRQFAIGDVFTGTYPPELATYCNGYGDRYPQEIEKSEDGQRRFQIVKVPDPTVDEVRAQKLAELDQKFLDWYEDKATVTSSLGFVADSDARAMMDTTGLVTTLEAMPAETRSTVAFMDAANTPHLLTLEQMKTVQLEIIQNGQAAYAQKWAFREAINAAETVEALNEIEIAFHGEDYSVAAS